MEDGKWESPGKRQQSEPVPSGDDDFLTPDLGDADAVDAEVAVAESPSAKPTPPPPVAKAAGADDDDDAMSERSAKSLVRRAAKAALEFESASDEHKKVVASAMGLRADADTIGLTVAVLTSDLRPARTLLREMVEANVSDLAEAIALSGRLAEDRSVASRWWRVAADIGLVEGSMPRVMSTATVQLVGGLVALTDEQRELLSAASDMMSWRR